MLPRGRLHSAVSQAATRFALVDPATTFKSKSTLELLRALLVFRLCTVRPLVAHGKEIIAASQRAFGRRLTSFAIRHTFFRHFCAGQSGGGAAALRGQAFNVSRPCSQGRVCQTSSQRSQSCERPASAESSTLLQSQTCPLLRRHLKLPQLSSSQGQRVGAAPPRRPTQHWTGISK